jgi:hypothetical protein
MSWDIQMHNKAILNGFSKYTAPQIYSLHLPDKVNNICLNSDLPSHLSEYFIHLGVYHIFAFLKIYFCHRLMMSKLLSSLLHFEPHKMVLC